MRGLSLLCGLKRPCPITVCTIQRLFTSFQEEQHQEACSSFLQKCVKTCNLHHGQALHAKLLKGSFPFSLFIRNHLLNMYFKCCDITSGLHQFDEMTQRNVISYSAAMSGLVQNGYAHDALNLFAVLLREGFVRPNEFTLVSALHACSLVEEDSGLAHRVYGFVVKLGFESNVYLINAFLTALIRNDRLMEAIEVFEKCPCKDVVSWNSMMAGYLQCSYSEVPHFLVRMFREGVTPDEFTFASILSGLAALAEIVMGIQVHGQIVKRGHEVEVCVGNALVDMYLKNQKLVEGFRAFDEMHAKDEVSWTQFAGGCLQCGEPGKALEIIGYMKVMGMMPNKFTLVTAANACANLASLEEGMKIHGSRTKLGDIVDVCVDNALVDMYVKCGCMDAAWGVFRSMRNRTVISWTTLIMGCAQNGQPVDALKAFSEMKKEAVEPNYITFIGVLYACSQGGLIEEGWEYFNSMSQDYGISPGEDHYACMVSLLARAGRIKEAEKLIFSMPFRPGLLVWQTLLAACQIHGDITTAKCAAENALALDKEAPSTYVLLANAFAGSSDWSNVEMLRAIMETRDVKKRPGFSWIGLDQTAMMSSIYVMSP